LKLRNTFWTYIEFLMPYGNLHTLRPIGVGLCPYHNAMYRSDEERLQILFWLGLPTAAQLWRRFGFGWRYPVLWEAETPPEHIHCLDCPIASH